MVSGSHYVFTRASLTALDCLTVLPQLIIINFPPPFSVSLSPPSVLDLRTATPYSFSRLHSKCVSILWIVGIARAIARIILVAVRILYLLPVPMGGEEWRVRLGVRVALRVLVRSRGRVVHRLWRVAFRLLDFLAFLRARSGFR